MKKFIVTYDLNKPGQDYKDLYSAFEQYDSRRVCKSSWIIKTNDSIDAQSIFNELIKNIDEGDVVFIAPIGKWVSRNKSDILDWLHED